MLKSVLVLSVLLALGVDDCQSTDPLLLEYSDYYYDLYYGDYEDYSPDTAGSGKNFHRIVRRLQNDAFNIKWLTLPTEISGIS